MRKLTPLIVCNEDDDSNIANIELDFENQEIDIFGFNHDQILESLIFKILTEPKALRVHLQRIFFCYQHNLTDDLFAALTDFLIILGGKGREISRRMVRGTKSKLSTSQYATLKNALNLSADELKLLKGNVYSLFSLGLIGSNVLVEKETQTKLPEIDPLDLARDYIAYSQLDTAMDTLENAIFVNFDRQELHDDLLELYKLTRSKDRFLKMYNSLSEKIATIPAAWNELKDFFNER